MTHREELHRRWIHSHEEDTTTEMVFRPDDYDFPPSRGRMGFELCADRTFRNLGIAPGDGTRESEGRWELEERGGELTISLTDPDGNRREMDVVAATPNRLAVRKN